MTNSQKIGLNTEAVKSTFDAWVLEQNGKGFTSLKLKEIIEGAIYKKQKSRTTDTIKKTMELATLENKLAAINRSLIK